MGVSLERFSLIFEIETRKNTKKIGKKGGKTRFKPNPIRLTSKTNRAHLQIIKITSP